MTVQVTALIDDAVAAAREGHENESVDLLWLLLMRASCRRSPAAATMWEQQIVERRGGAAVRRRITSTDIGLRITRCYSDVDRSRLLEALRPLAHREDVSGWTVRYR